jgi:RNA polymerase sigma-70 factor (ECF subfamily)
MSTDLRALTDEELLIRCRKADNESAREIVGIVAERYSRPLYNYIYRMVGSEQLAEDLLQDVCMRLYRHRRHYRSVAKCSTWLYRIATNLALNAIRNTKRHGNLSLSREADETGADYASVLPSREETPDDIAARRDLQAIVQGILVEIPDKYRVVLVLCDVEGRSYIEAADVLEVAVGTIRSRLSRAREYFQKKFAPHIRELEAK